MKKFIQASALFACLIASSAFATQPIQTEKSVTSGNIESIAGARLMLGKWLEAFNQRDIESLTATMDDQIVYMNASSPAAIGLDAVKGWYGAVFPNIEGMTMQYQENYAFAGEDIAVLVGTYLLKPPASVDQPGQVGRVTLVYQKSDAGDWKLVHDIDNNPPDALPELFGN